ncbi:MAG TPA: hypothetical protein VF501_00680, partial [Thiobacillus sp.]
LGGGQGVFVLREFGTQAALLATTENGRHYFAVYAALQGSLPALRPGLEGVVKIDVDRRSLLANWAARSVGWLRLKLWSWGA